MNSLGGGGGNQKKKEKKRIDLNCGLNPFGNEKVSVELFFVCAVLSVFSLVCFGREIEILYWFEKRLKTA